MRLYSGLPFIALFAAAACAQSPFFHQDFEAKTAGWTAFGAKSAKVQITHEPASVKNGKGALEFDYEASNSEPAVAILPLTQPLPGLQSLRLWVKGTSPMAAAVSLTEKEGGRYLAIFWLDGDTWQRVELTPEDFILSTNQNDPKDPDGKLDLDQVEAIGIVDISQIINPIMAAHAPLMVAEHAGPQKLFIDDFEVSAERPAWFHPRAPFEIETFSHPQLDWFTLGGADLKLDTSRKVMAVDALEASYQQIPDRFPILLHPMPQMDLAGATHLAFDIASDNQINLIVALIEQAPGKTEGPHYNANIEVPGGGKTAHREVALSAFDFDSNGPADPAGKLDLARLKTIGILDVTSAYTQQTGANTIRIGNIKAMKTQALPQ